MQSMEATPDNSFLQKVRVKSLSHLQLVHALFWLHRTPLPTLRELFRRYGDVVHLPVPQKETFFFYHPEDAQSILLDQKQEFIKSINYQEFSPLLGLGLVTSDGELWKNQRKLIQPEFSLHEIEKYHAIMVSQTKLKIAEWQKHVQEVGPVIEVAGEMMELTFNIIGQSLFGTDLIESVETVKHSFPLVADYIMQRVYVKFPKSLPLPGFIKSRRALQELNREMFNIIANERANIAHASQRDNFLAKLIAASEKCADNAMSVKQLRDEAITMLLAGHETTSNAVTWTLYLLSRNPEIQEQVREELREVMQGKVPTFEHYKQLDFLRMVFCEGIRLYPPAWLISRTPLHDVQVRDTRVPQGSVVDIPIWMIHRHPEFWDQPELFDPQRFSKEASKGRHPYAYLPFGAGKRRCLGSEFAMVEGVTLLAMILQQFEVEPVTAFKVEAAASLTLRPKYGLKLKFFKHKAKA